VRGKIAPHKKTLINKQMNYRREIDGLRALAVLPVILFHAGFEAFSGGFVGVDVFFVISGYLITSIIIAELAQGKFSIINFYERRARRILPALFFVILVCMPFAWLWLLPADLEDFSQSLVAVAAFASNIHFLRESGYFDAAVELKPLLHTWSLAVEEQYYVLFPLFLVLMWRFGRRWVIASLALLGMTSLMLAQWGSNAKPEAAFYLLPTRGWELLVGAYVAFYFSSNRRVAASRSVHELGGLVGVMLLIYSVFAFDQYTPFPSLYTLAPTVGTALIILYASQSTFVGRLLGIKAFVGLGLISYSAYLWHQPLFAFARHRNLHEPGESLFAVLAAASLVLAYFSWRFVETPFRDKKAFSRKSIFAFSAVGALSVVSLGTVGQLTNGAFFRADVDTYAGLDDRLSPNYGLSFDCTLGFNESSKCKTHEQPEFLVWGDSYAMHLVDGLKASRPDIKLVQQTISACGPVLGVAPIGTRHPRPWAEQCIAYNDNVFNYLENSRGIRYVIMSSLFRQYLGYENYSVMQRNGAIVDDGSVAYDALRETLDRIKSLGKVPVLFSPTAQNGQDIGRCLITAIGLGRPLSSCDIQASEAEINQRRVYDLLRKLEDDYPVIWLHDELCVGGLCKSHDGDTLIYRDKGHLSHEGSAYLGRKMDFYSHIIHLK
jgi:peptidoglycan/LPS O-acetylase OafA/YrhL